MIGLTDEQKRCEIARYMADNGLSKSIVFSPKQFMLGAEREIDWDEIIMYRTFYPLLAEIDDTYLLVMNEMMRDRNRSCLTYNCLAKYTNQSRHRLVFEWTPFIDGKSDMMILLDMNNSQMYKGRGIKEIDLSGEPIQCVRRSYELDVKRIELPTTAAQQYEAEKEKLFDGIGNKDPDTIPRNLHAWCGKFKAPYIQDGERYVARNARYKNPSVSVYKDVTPGTYTILDFQHSQKDMNDFFKRSQTGNHRAISSGLKVDEYYISRHNDWWKEVRELYAETGIYQQDG